jgi:hypothetical protein
MSVVDTAGAPRALREGRRVEAIGLTIRKNWRGKTKAKPERHEVLTIEPAGQGYAVTFAGGRVRVFTERGTFWVGG